jgi:hypothetical protein
MTPAANLPPASLTTIVANFTTGFTTIYVYLRELDVTASVVVIGGKFPLISTTPKVHVPPLSLTRWCTLNFDICEFTTKKLK